MIFSLSFSFLFLIMEVKKIVTRDTIHNVERYVSHFHGRCAPFAAECAQSVDSRVIIAAECIQYARELLQDATKCRMMFTNACLHINKTDTRPLC